MVSAVCMCGVFEVRVLQEQPRSCTTTLAASQHQVTTEVWKTPASRGNTPFSQCPSQYIILSWKQGFRINFNPQHEIFCCSIYLSVDGCRGSSCCMGFL